MSNNLQYNILVIGSTGHQGVTNCIEWGSLVYVGDYDALIIDTTTLTEEKLLEIIQEDNGYFNKLKKDISDVQEKRGIAISCIISPYVFSKTPNASENVNEVLKNNVNNYSWSPIIPIFEKIPDGQKLNKDKSTIAREYLDKISSYSLLFDGCVNNTGYVDKTEDKKIYTKLHDDSLLNNIIGRSVAFAITWKVHQYSDYTVLVDGNLPIKFIPPTDNINDGINILIKELSKISEEAAPDWVSGVTLPGENEIEEQIDKKMKSIELTNIEIQDLEKEKANLNIYKKLLHSQGAELEEIVEKSFLLFGIDLQKPSVANIEDRYFKTSDDKRIYFEVRGVNRLMNESDLAQLIKRVAEKPKSDKYNTRGIFVFNHQNRLRPDERSNAFHHNIEKQAKSFNLCLIDTITLFNLVIKKLEGDGDYDFNMNLLNTVGIFTAPQNTTKDDT